MRKGFKIAIVTVVAIVALFFIAAIASGPYVNANVNEIAGIKNFVVIHESGDLYTARFSLVDNELGAAADNAYLHYSICGIEGEKQLSTSDFKEYALQLTGSKFIAYAWQIDSPEICSSYNSYIEITLSDGRFFDESTTVLG